MNFAKLKGKMRECGYTQARLAKCIGITPQALNAKLNGRSQFTVEEAYKICSTLEIKEPNAYFFKKNPKNATMLKGVCD